MSRRDSTPLYKLIVLGDGGVGKTALTIQLCLNRFVETYDPTIEDSYRKQVLLDGQTSTLEVLDTAGQEEYTALRDQWIRDGEGFILVYSITSRSSFSRIKSYYSQIQRVKEDDEPFALVLVGNKSDRSAERTVSTREGQSLARELGNAPFFESSAKLNVNIEDAFLDCARKCRQIRQPERPIGSSPTVPNAYGTEDGSGSLSSNANNASSSNVSPRNGANNNDTVNSGYSSQNNTQHTTTTQKSSKKNKKKEKCCIM